MAEAKQYEPDKTPDSKYRELHHILTLFLISPIDNFSNALIEIPVEHYSALPVSSVSTIGEPNWSVWINITFLLGVRSTVKLLEVVGLLQPLTLQALRSTRTAAYCRRRSSFPPWSIIIFLAKQLKFKVVAEGVETSEQLVFLKANQCDLVQGFYFSEPIPAHKAMIMLESQSQRLSGSRGAL